MIVLVDKSSLCNYKIDVDDGEARPRYTALALRNVSCVLRGRVISPDGGSRPNVMAVVCWSAV